MILEVILLYNSICYITGLHDCVQELYGTTPNHIVQANGKYHMMSGLKLSMHRRRAQVPDILSVAMQYQS